MHPTGPRIKSMLCFWKKKNSAKMQINMTHTGGQKSTENLHLESEKDSSARYASSGQADYTRVTPCMCFHSSICAGWIGEDKDGHVQCERCGCVYAFDKGTRVYVRRDVPPGQ